MKAPVLGRRAGSIIVFAAVASVLATAPAAAAESQAMANDCRAVAADTAESRRRAEQWVRERLEAFQPTPEQALRMRSLELQAEQVKLALGAISSTCAQYLEGRIAREVADRSLHGFEQTIRNFVHDLGNEILVVAAAGQVADIPSIRDTLTQIGAAGRQAALLGEDAIADEAVRTMVRTLVAFSTTFVESSCWDQVFDDVLPLEINRQNEILGTGIDVTPCAQRYFYAPVSPLTFESCSIGGVGTWRLSWMLMSPMTTGGVADADLVSDRDRATGSYSVDWGANGVDYRAKGEMAVHRRRGGPGENSTYTLSGDMDVRLVRGKQRIVKLESLMGVKTKPAGGPFVAELQVSPKPCKELPPLRSFQLPFAVPAPKD